MSSTTNAPCSNPSTTCSASPTGHFWNATSRRTTSSGNRTRSSTAACGWRPASRAFWAWRYPRSTAAAAIADFRYNTIVTEETVAGRYSGIGFALHNDVVAPYLLRLANEEQKQRWLPQFCTGEIDHGDRHDRARHGQRPAGHQDPRRQGRRPLHPQRREDVHHQRHPLRPGDRGGLHRSRQGRAGLLAAGRRTRHGGLRARPQARQDRAGRAGHRRIVVHRCEGARREPARRGGPGLRLSDAEPAPGAHRASR